MQFWLIALSVRFDLRLGKQPTLGKMECSAVLSAAFGVRRQRRYRCACTGHAEHPVSADPWHINNRASLCRALSQAKHAGFLWRQTAREQQRGLFWPKGRPPTSARAVQEALDILLELDLRLMCEVSGQETFMDGQPRLLQQMISEPGLVLARPGWLRAFLFQIWIGAALHPHPPFTPIPPSPLRYDAHVCARRRSAARTPRICKMGRTSL